MPVDPMSPQSKPTREAIIALIKKPEMDISLANPAQRYPWGAIHSLHVPQNPDLELFLQAIAIAVAATFLARTAGGIKCAPAVRPMTLTCRYFAGRVVLAKAAGIDLKAVRIWKDQQRWVGHMHTVEPRSAPIDRQIQTIAWILGGVIAELTDMKSYVPGSSADDVGVAHAIAVAIALVTKKNPLSLIDSIINAVDNHLETHCREIEILSFELARHHVLSAEALMPITNGVSPIAIPTIDALEEV
jgi:hypothetical protein